MTIALEDLPVVNGQVLVRIASDVPLNAWVARLRIEGPTVTDVRALISVGVENLASIKTAPSLAGRPYELFIIDPDGRAHLLGTGFIVTGVLAVPVDFTYDSLFPESIPGGGPGGPPGGSSNLYVQEDDPSPVGVNSLWIELNPDGTPYSAWVVTP